MYRTILVPVDLTDKNIAAIETARDLVTDDGVVTLFHVIETLDAPFEELEDFYRDLEEKARERLETFAEPLRSAGVTWEARVTYGKCAPEIVSFAADQPADLIVITSHPIDPDNFAKSFMTISHQVAIVAGPPVLILR